MQEPMELKQLESLVRSIEFLKPIGAIMSKFNPLPTTLFLILAMLTTSCVRKTTLTMLSDRVETSGKHGISITASLEKSLSSINIKLKTKTDSTSQERSILNAINSGEEDLALIKNSIPIDDSYSNIRTVMPLFPEVFLTLYKRSASRPDFDSLVTHGKIVFIINKEEELQLINQFLEMLNLKSNEVVYLRGNISVDGFSSAINEGDVIMLFSSLNNDFVRKLLHDQDLAIYDFNSNQYQSGSVIDGFCMRFSQAVPFIIPQGMFNSLPEAPVQTFAVYDVLVCNSDLESELVYDAIEAIFNHKARLAQENFEFAMLDENLDSHTFLFPLHTGATAFINRNQPTFWERYAELIGVVVSIFAISAGAISTSFHKLKQRKKDKIDEYYMKVMAISDKCHRFDTPAEELNVLQEKLLRIRSHVFRLLIDERIQPNSAFIIFLLLTQSTEQQIESRLEKFNSFNETTLSQSDSTLF